MIKFLKNYHRQSIRLRNYDYRSQGLYYITICAQNRELYFNNSDIKRIIENCWLKMPEHFKNVDLDEYVIMPNHLHGIIIINDINIRRGDPCGRPNNKGNEGNHKGYPYDNLYNIENRGDPCGRPNNEGNHKGYPYDRPRLGDIIGAFKSITANYYIHGIKTKNWPGFDKRLWQRNYYEHIIRNEQSLNKIREYIENNPLNWETDRNNPKNYKI